jgi:hypothetical protein
MAPRFFCRAARAGGWTLAEFSMIVVIAAVLVYMSVRVFAPLEAQAFQQAERLRNDVRHIQMLALTWNQPLRLTLASATSYEVCCLNAAMTACTTGAAPCAANPVVDPATGRSFRVDLESGLTVSGTSPLEFDKLGRPCNGAALRTGSVSLAIAGGPSGRSVVIAPITGFASVQ